MKADPDALRRLLRALIGRGIFRQRRDGRYALNALATSLRTNAPLSAAAMARMVGSVQHREHWSYLTDAIRTGKAVIPALHGMRKPSTTSLGSPNSMKSSTAPWPIPLRWRWIT